MDMNTVFMPGGNIFDEDEIDVNIEFSTMEHLLYGYYYEDYEDIIDNKENKTYYDLEHLLELWRKYVEIDEENQVVWEFNFQMFQWKDIKGILENLEKIKMADEALFAKLFTGNLVSCLLYEIERLPKEILTKRNKEFLAKWIQKNKVGEFSDRDFWKVVKYHTLTNNEGMERLAMDNTTLKYSYLWKRCCKKPIYLSMKESVHRETYQFCTLNAEELCLNSYMLEFVGLPLLLKICDGILGMEGFSKDNHLIALIEDDNKELLYECLRKNFVNKRMAKNRLEYAMENQRYDLIPLLLLKCHGEWPEGKVLE